MAATSGSLASGRGPRARLITAVSKKPSTTRIARAAEAAAHADRAARRPGTAAPLGCVGAAAGVMPVGHGFSTGAESARSSAGTAGWCRIASSSRFRPDASSGAVAAGSRAIVARISWQAATSARCASDSMVIRSKASSRSCSRQLSRYSATEFGSFAKPRPAGRGAAMVGCFTTRWIRFTSCCAAALAATLASSSRCSSGGKTWSSQANRVRTVSRMTGTPVWGHVQTRGRAATVSSSQRVEESGEIRTAVPATAKKSGNFRLPG